MNSFTRKLLVLVFCGIGSSLGIAGLSSVAKYKPYGVPDLLRGPWEAKQAAIRQSQAERRLGPAGERHMAVPDAAPAQPHPRAVTDETEFDFGMLEPGGTATHVFTVRNEGDAPLVLSAGETSCKCTLSEVSSESVAPGDAAEIRLTWNTASERQYYRQYAVIRTNDPARAEIDLAVSGTVKTMLGFDVQELVDPEVAPEHGAEATAVLFSQTMSDFTIAEVSCNLPGFQSRVEPLVDTELAALRASSGWRLVVSTAAALETGEFSGQVRVRVEGDQLPPDDAWRVREIGFRGRVLPRISFYGAGLYRDTGLDLGVSPQGKEVKARVSIRVRGTRPPAELIVSRIEPSFLEAAVVPSKTRPGIFTLTLRVPPQAPSAIFNTEQQHGFVEVCDPRNPDCKSWFPVHGAIIGMDDDHG